PTRQRSAVRCEDHRFHLPFVPHEGAEQRRGELPPPVFLLRKLRRKKRWILLEKVRIPVDGAMQTEKLSPPRGVDREGRQGVQEVWREIKDGGGRFRRLECPTADLRLQEGEIGEHLAEPVQQRLRPSARRDEVGGQVPQRVEAGVAAELSPPGGMF